MQVAARAYETWRPVPAPVRAEMLFKAAQLLVGFGVERRNPLYARRASGGSVRHPDSGHTPTGSDEPGLDRVQ
jgi:hypothetical protein